MNRLVDERDVEVRLDEVLDLPRVLALPYFADHDRDGIEMILGAARDLARDVLYPAYRAMDAEPPRLVDGRVHVHPKMKELFARLVDMGLVAAPRPKAVGGDRDEANQTGFIELARHLYCLTLCENKPFGRK